MSEGKEEEKPDTGPAASNAPSEVPSPTEPEAEAAAEDNVGEDVAEDKSKGKKKKKKEKKQKKEKKKKEKDKTKGTETKEVKVPEKPKSRYFEKFEEGIESQEGKIIVITGTTSGTGLVAAKTALKKGARVILLNRNEEKARKALEEFFEKHEGTQERAQFVLCDLQNFESVKKAAEIVSDLCKDTGIDILVNNAGVMALEDKATEDGYDVQMQTNHLSHFLLTKQLFSLLEKRAQEKGEARLVNHSSGARRMPMTPLRAKYLGKNGGKLGGNGSSMVGGARWQRYHQSKLANSVFTMEMKRRLIKSESKVKALCAYPGLAATELQKTTQEDGGLKGLNFMKRSQSQEDGAMGILQCMFYPKAVNGGMYGPYFMKGKVKKRNHGWLTTRKAGNVLWKESEEACGEFTIPKAVVAES